MKIVCTLPNASLSINGIEFEPIKDGIGVISKGDVPDEVAAHLMSIPGYHEDGKSPVDKAEEVTADGATASTPGVSGGTSAPEPEPAPAPTPAPRKSAKQVKAEKAAEAAKTETAPQGSTAPEQAPEGDTPPAGDTKEPTDDSASDESAPEGGSAPESSETPPADDDSTIF